MSNVSICPNCGRDDHLYATEESIFNINTEEYFCTSIRYTDSNAKVACHYCDWGGIRSDLQTKIELEVVPTHWMDNRGMVASDEWINGPYSNDDYRKRYNIPCIIIDNNIVRLSEK